MYAQLKLIQIIQLFQASLIVLTVQHLLLCTFNTISALIRSFFLSEIENSNGIMRIFGLGCVLVVLVHAQVRYPISNDPMSYYEYDNTAGQFVTRRCAAGQTYDSLSAQCIAASIIWQQTVQQSVAFQQTQVFGPAFNFVQIPGLDTVCGTQGSVIYINGAPVTCQNPTDCFQQSGICTGVLGGSSVVYCCRYRTATTPVTVSSGYSAACANYGSAAYRNNQIWSCDTLADITECLGLQRGTCQSDSTGAAPRWYCCFQGGNNEIISVGDSICQTFGYVMRENTSPAPCYNCMTKYGGFCLMNNADQQWYCCSWRRQPFVYSDVQQPSISSRVTGTCPDNTIGNMCDINMQCPAGFLCSNYVCCPYNPSNVQTIPVYGTTTGALPVDDVISQNATFPNRSFLVPIQSLQPASPTIAPRVLNLSTLEDFGVKVEKSSLIAETGRLSYFYIWVPPTQTRNYRDVNTIDSVGIRFGNAATLNVVPLSLASVPQSGLSILTTRPDGSRVYQLGIRMPQTMCQGAQSGSCIPISYKSYSLSQDGKSGAAGEFSTALPVACGSQCDAPTNSPCFTPCDTCDDEQVAGADTPVSRRYKMGINRATVNFQWQTYSIPDRIMVLYNGQYLLDTACVGATSNNTISYDGTTDEIRVDVEPNCQGTTGTEWNFRLSCPPKQACANTPRPRCTALAAAHDCEFYKCYDEDARCGPDGYLIGYGYKYCTGFYKYMNDFDYNGTTFVSCVRNALIDSVNNLYQQKQCNCTTILNTEFAVHSDIYLQCNFCGMLNWKNIIALYKTFDLSDFLSQQAWSQVCKVARGCNYGWVYSGCVAACNTYYYASYLLSGETVDCDAICNQTLNGIC